MIEHGYPKREPDRNASEKTHETSSKKILSLFPINHALTHSTLQRFNARIKRRGKETVIKKGMAKIRNNGKALFTEVDEGIWFIKDREHPESDELCTAYLLGAVAGYEILGAQAEVRQTNIPTVSHAAIDLLFREVRTNYLEEDELKEATWDEISQKPDEYQGFIIPLQAAVFDTCGSPLERLYFLRSALDVYDMVKSSEETPVNKAS